MSEVIFKSIKIKNYLSHEDELLHAYQTKEHHKKCIAPYTTTQDNEQKRTWDGECLPQVEEKTLIKSKSPPKEK